MGLISDVSAVTVDLPVPSTGGGGGGGPGQPGPVIPPTPSPPGGPNYNFSESIMLPSIDASLFTHNDDGEARVSGWGRFKQDVDNTFFQYKDSHLGFFVDPYNPDRFHFSAYVSVYVLDELPFDTRVDITRGISPHLPDLMGFDVYSSLDVRNETIWVLDEITGEYDIIPTDNINVNFRFNLEFGVIDNTYLGLYEWTDYYTGNQVVEMSMSGSGYFVPEPTTICILGLGGIFMTRTFRRRRIS
jgi:hypothetical protein